MPELVVSIPRTVAGNVATEHLRGPGGQRDLGVIYLEALHTRLMGLQSGARLMDLNHTFHRLKVEEGHEAAAINRIMQWHNGEGAPRSVHGRVEAAEPDLIFRTSATLGLPFQLGGLHQTYLQLMKVDDAHRAGVKGNDITVAVIDSGADPAMKKPVDDFYDIESGNPIHPAPQVDYDGHGTAMSTLVQQVAPEASVVAIRVFNQDKLNLWNVLAGTGTAVFDCRADIVSISLGYVQMPANCGICGASAQSRSLAFQYLLDGVAQAPGKRGSPPVYVAATGNDYSSGGFNYPAAYDSAVAIGSVTSTLDRSLFSNYGKKNPKYFFMTPGGEENPVGNVLEDVGTGGGVRCRGTSVASAYAAGMLALLWSDRRYRGEAPDVFLASLIQHHVLALPQGQADTLEYGSGLLRYMKEAPESEVIETTEAVTLLKLLQLRVENPPPRIAFEEDAVILDGVRVPIHKPR